MTLRKEAELNVSILQFIVRCRMENDGQMLKDLGISRDDADLVGDLSFGDYDALSKIPYPILRRSAVDRDLLRLLVKRLHAIRESRRLRDQLIALDAPFPMMNKYLGMDAKEYASLGRRLRINRPKGRPQEPTETEERLVLHVYRTLRLKDLPSLTLSDYLALAHESKLSVRIVWTVIHRGGVHEAASAQRRCG